MSFASIDSPWSKVVPGTLVDSDIKTLAEAGELIRRGYHPEGVKQACYELHASDTFYNTRASDEERRIVVSSGNGYILHPHTYVTCIVEESIQLPSNVLARVLTKGQLFSVGILPVNTYADPGFEGRLGITLCNVSHRSVIIRPGEAIAKIEFSVLPKSVERPYNGQHGYETQIWPVPTWLYADRGLMPGTFGGYKVSEVEESYGPVIASVERRLQYYSGKVWLQLGATITLFAVLMALYERIPLVVSVLTGVTANLLTHVGMVMVERRRR